MFKASNSEEEGRVAQTCLIVGSIAAWSGKTAAIVGMASQLQQRGLDVRYGKPLRDARRSRWQTETGAEEVRAIAQAMGIDEAGVSPPLADLEDETLEKALERGDTGAYAAALPAYVEQLGGDVVLLEGPPTLAAGKTLQLGVRQMAAVLEAPVLLLARDCGWLSVDRVLHAKSELGDRLLGVAIADIASDRVEFFTSQVQPFFAREGIALYGLLPRHSLLNSVSVGEIAQELEATVLCAPNRLGLLVENLTIGAMNVNSALEYFRQGRNLAVVTGGDRSDLQLAAMETSANCLVLTGRVRPQKFVLERAESLEIPILTSDRDTLATVQAIDRTFNRARLQEPIQLECMRELMHQHLDTSRLIEELGLGK